MKYFAVLLFENSAAAQNHCADRRRVEEAQRELTRHGRGV